MQRQKISGARKLLLCYKIVFPSRYLYAFSDRHRVLVSKFDDIQDAIALYMYTVVIILLSIE